MINLIAISYKNIGPFQDKLLSVFFNSGKMLIKAPIGSGKSFLFFDGPIYGLYKYSSRNILNTKSKNGYIKLIFEINKETYIIIRNIKKGKSKDSCESKLYKIEGDLSLFDQQSPLEKDKDVELMLRQQTDISREEISFKNETDLQQTLQTILPPREVIMNTIFLMQDSDNIFELTPVDRLTILKNVFNLMGIDEAKEVLADKKREIRYKIKSKTDISKYDEKLKTNIQKYIQTLNDTKILLKDNIDFSKYQAFFDERILIEEKIQIADFSLNGFPTDREKELHLYIEQKKSQQQKLTHQLETIQQDIVQQQTKQKEQDIDINKLKLTIETLQTKIKNSDEKKTEALKTEKQGYIQEQNLRENKIPKNIIRAYMVQQGKETEEKESGDITILSSYLFIQQCIHEGKRENEEIKNIQLQLQHEEVLEKNETEKINTQRKYLQEKREDQKAQQEKIGATLLELEKNIDTQATFDCEKIQGKCPFIKVINKKTFDQLEQQKANIQQQQKEIETTIQALTKEIQEKENTMPTNNKQKKEELEKEKNKVEQRIASIKKFLQNINYKEIEILYGEYTNQEKQIKELDKVISQQELESKQLEERKLDLQKANIQKESGEKNSETHIQTIQEKQKQQEQLLKLQEQNDNQTLLQIEKNQLIMQQTYRDIDLLINEFTEQQLERKKLEEQEAILGNLYTIFSKELLLLVLQDHLPVLNDIINSFLSQIVDYQISLQLNKSDADKVELEAKIIDEKGIRDTKSLSGGQRIILKLIRMLAISSYINSPILFLDETINNLDEDTVGKVAIMLEDFVKQRDIKLYTITHSQQIQQMDIRDQTIEI